MTLVLGGGSRRFLHVVRPSKSALRIAQRCCHHRICSAIFQCQSARRFAGMYACTVGGTFRWAIEWTAWTDACMDQQQEDIQRHLTLYSRGMKQQ